MTSKRERGMGREKKRGIDRGGERKRWLGTDRQTERERGGIQRQGQGEREGLAGGGRCRGPGQHRAAEHRLTTVAGCVRQQTHNN